MVEKNITVLNCDGIGPEIMNEGVKSLMAVGERFGHSFILSYQFFGGDAYFRCGNPYPEETKTSCLSADAVLKGPMGLDSEGRRRLEAEGVKLENDALLPLRADLDVYACYRPLVLPPRFFDFSPLKPEVLGEGVDIMMIRELVGGAYFGKKIEGSDTNWKYAVDEAKYEDWQVQRIAHVAFKEARKRNCKLTNTSKPNIMATSRFWDHWVHEVAKEYPDVKLEDMIIDNNLFQLVKNPTQFNGVLLYNNEFGDLATDEGGGILGSLGLMPSPCLNPETGRGIYEPAHGSAPDIAGQNKANPYSMIGSVAMMLEYSFRLERESEAVWNALRDVFGDGYRTLDLANHLTSKKRVVTTSEFGNLVAQRIA